MRFARIAIGGFLAGLGVGILTILAAVLLIWGIGAVLPFIADWIDALDDAVRGFGFSPDDAHNVTFFVLGGGVIGAIVALVSHGPPEPTLGPPDPPETVWFGVESNVENDYRADYKGLYTTSEKWGGSSVETEQEMRQAGVPGTNPPPPPPPDRG